MNDSDLPYLSNCKTESERIPKFGTQLIKQFQKLIEIFIIRMMENASLKKKRSRFIENSFVSFFAASEELVLTPRYIPKIL